MTKCIRTKWDDLRILESILWTSILQFTDHSHLAQFITSWVAEASRTESKGWRGGTGWHFSLVLLLFCWLLFPSPPARGALCGCRSSSSRALCPLHASCSSSSLPNPLLSLRRKTNEVRRKKQLLGFEPLNWEAALRVQPCHTQTVQTPGSYLASLCPTSPTCLLEWWYT